MIRSYFGIEKDPFSHDSVMLLDHQEEVCDILEVHSQQGGLCLLMGEPGTGKTVIKETIKQRASKRITVISVARTLHTYTNTIKILCQAFNINFTGTHFSCEKRLIEEAFNLKREGNKLIIIVDDAHLMEMQTLRRIRLLLEDFPKNYNLILVGQPALLHSMNLKVNDDIKSRITYSVVLKRLGPEDMKAFILKQLDLAGLGHNTFSEEAIDLIVRSADGVLRRTRNLCIGSLLEALRAQKKIIDIDLVNRVLIQPHWRNEYDFK
ncbi:MAG: AAA family ATPase [Spirochaetales bacterium]|nr:AAA family ATPase [Spirochaetales bacterium]